MIGEWTNIFKSIDYNCIILISRYQSILNIESYYEKIKIYILLRKKRFYRLIECTERVANAICFYGMA